MIELQKMLKTFDGKHIFLTGGTGFFGKSILDMLKKGFLGKSCFTILSRDPEAFLHRNPEYSGMDRVRFIKGDIRDFVFPAGRFDGMIHGATPAVTTLQPGEMRNIILEGSKRVLEFARHAGIPRLLFISSGAVYGPLPSGVLRAAETLPCVPVTEYGIAKLEAEKMFFSSGISSVAARCFAFIGPRLELDIHFAVGNFLRNCLNGEEIIVKGDGTPLRSYLYADDLVEWLFTILARGRAGESYNVGSPEAISIAELAAAVAGRFDPVPSVRLCREPVPGAEPERYVPDVSKAMSELGLQVNVPLGEAVELCKNFHRKRGNFKTPQNCQSTLASI